MKRIPDTKDALVLRTDFSDNASWKSLCKTIREPAGEFQAYVDFVSDPAFNGIDVEQVLSLIPPNYNHSFIFIIDQTTLSHPEHPVLVVDLFDEPGRTFRVIPAEMWGVENNLSLANMIFADFADHADPEGVFRGFPLS